MYLYYLQGYRNIYIYIYMITWLMHNSVLINIIWQMQLNKSLTFCISLHSNLITLFSTQKIPHGWMVFALIRIQPLNSLQPISKICRCIYKMHKNYLHVSRSIADDVERLRIIWNISFVLEYSTHLVFGWYMSYFTLFHVEYGEYLINRIWLQRLTQIWYELKVHQSILICIENKIEWYHFFRYYCKKYVSSLLGIKINISSAIGN